MNARPSANARRLDQAARRATPPAGRMSRAAGGLSARRRTATPIQTRSRGRAWPTENSAEPRRGREDRRRGRSRARGLARAVQVEQHDQRRRPERGEDRRAQRPACRRGSRPGARAGCASGGLRSARADSASVTLMSRRPRSARRCGTDELRCADEGQQAAASRSSARGRCSASPASVSSTVWAHRAAVPGGPSAVRGGTQSRSSRSTAREPVARGERGRAPARRGGRPRRPRQARWVGAARGGHGRLTVALRVAVYGAPGYTGRLVAAELRRRG